MPAVAILPSSKGYHWEEVFDAFKVFKEAGWDVSFYTVNGAKPNPDPQSIQNRPFLSYLGLGMRDSFSPDSPLGVELLGRLQARAPISELNVDKMNAIYIPGGHGCLFDVNINETVHEKILAAYNKGKVIGAVCHGTSCLAFVKKPNGESIIKDKKVIGFLDSMDELLLNMGLIDESMLPLPYKNEQKMKDAGAIISEGNKLMAAINPTYYVIDVPFITGVGPKSAKLVAEKMVGL